jgi:26S proteasome regulatory subunit N11
MKEQLNYLNNFKFEEKIFDINETVQISSLALLKIIRHAQLGIPIEVMGIMLGKFLDKNTIIIFDTFAMPQMGTKITVEAIDPIFQSKMLDMLIQIGRNDIIIGWYHSHPGFGCWLSGVDINTQKSFEQLNNRSVALVIDPIQSIKGNVVLEIFRLIPFFNENEEIREINTLEFGNKNNWNINDEENGSSKNYYSLNISFRKNSIEILSIASMFETAWNVNFFCTYLNKKLEKNTIKNLSNIFKNLVKMGYNSDQFKNKWLCKNFQKIYNIKNEMFFFFGILIRETVFFFLNKILLKSELF